MKGRQFVTILVLLTLIGGVGMFLYHRTSESWKSTSSSSTADRKFVNFPINDVDQVLIKGRGGEVNLVRENDGWKVKERNYPANFEQISSMVRKIWELRPLQEVEVGPSQFSRLELTPPGQEAASGVLVELKDSQGKRIAALLLGKKYLKQADVPLSQTGLPAGRYLKAEDGSNRVVLVSDTFDEVEAKPEKWLNHDFFKAENPRSISLASPTADLNWILIRNSATEPWKLRDAKPGEEVDNAKVSSIPATLMNPTFADAMTTNPPPTETGLDKPSVVTTETFDNFTYVVRIGKQMGENYPVTVSVSAQLAKERTSGKDEKPEDKARLDQEFQTKQKERTPGKDEKPEDKARLDQEFQTKQKELTERLTKEQKLADHIYLVAKTSVDQLLKPRSALLAEKKSPSPTPSPSAGGKSPSPAQTPAASPSKRPRQPRP